MRIISGSARGIQLRSPASVTRPTSDRVREAIFSTLQHVVPEASVLDLFAGSGALGIEALSRGASSCLFVEDNARAIKITRQNLETTHLLSQARLLTQDALKFIHNATAEFDLILADPPYFRSGTDDYASPLLNNPLPLKKDGLLLLEVESERDTPKSLPHLELLKRKDYGNTSFFILARKEPPPTARLQS